MVPVLLLPRYLAHTRAGYLAYHIFVFLKNYERTKLLFDDSDPYFIEKKVFKNYDWTESYPDTIEKISTKIPEPLETAIKTICFVDADHACKR